MPDTSNDNEDKDDQNDGSITAVHGDHKAIFFPLEVESAVDSCSYSGIVAWWQHDGRWEQEWFLYMWVFMYVVYVYICMYNFICACALSIIALVSAHHDPGQLYNV